MEIVDLIVGRLHETIRNGEIGYYFLTVEG